MTKSDLVKVMAGRNKELSSGDAELVVTFVLKVLGESLADGRRIEIRGFGSFGLNNRPSRISRNPKTGERVVVPPKVVPHFKAGKDLRKRVTSPPGKFPDAEP